MTAYARGTRRENDLKGRLEDRGWFVVRSAKSGGPADLVALKTGEAARLIQVKTDKASPWANFGPHERQELATVANTVGAAAVLCWWPPDGKGPRFYELVGSTRPEESDVQS